mmetsp:Transcript_53130/g.122042  ORF Transcript_53130/g.122042 Transcript_53130/m.122042 type:complete len:332 (-) Transcript_53130:42-1037(-)
MSATSRSANVSCGDVTLKLTLSVAQLKKPFETAVLLPFLKAYGKRAALPLPLAITDVIAVEVDGTKLGDCSIAASIVLLTSESIPVRVHLRAGAGQPSALGDNPFATGTPFVNQAKSDVERMVDFDGKSEVERLKEKRRAARLAREADAALSDTPAPRAGAAESVSLCSGDVVTVNGLESDAGKAINGRKGTIVHYVAEKGRYAVLLDGQDGRVNIRPSNLQVFSAGTPDAVTEAEGKSKGEREREGEVEVEREGERGSPNTAADTPPLAAPSSEPPPAPAEPHETPRAPAPQPSAGHFQDTSLLPAARGHADPWTAAYAFVLRMCHCVPQ